MNQLEQAAAETRERLSEKELESLERLAKEALTDESLAREFVMSPGAILEEYGLSESTMEGAVVEVVDPETEEDKVFCFHNFTHIFHEMRIFCKWLFWGRFSSQ